MHKKLILLVIAFVCMGSAYGVDGGDDQPFMYNSIRDLLNMDIDNLPTEQNSLFSAALESRSSAILKKLSKEKKSEFIALAQKLISKKSEIDDKIANKTGKKPENTLTERLADQLTMLWAQGLDHKDRKNWTRENLERMKAAHKKAAESLKRPIMTKIIAIGKKVKQAEEQSNAPLDKNLPPPPARTDIDSYPFDHKTQKADIYTHPGLLKMSRQKSSTEKQRPKYTDFNKLPEITEDADDIYPLFDNLETDATSQSDSDYSSDSSSSSDSDYSSESDSEDIGTTGQPSPKGHGQQASEGKRTPSTGDKPVNQADAPAPAKPVKPTAPSSITPQPDAQPNTPFYKNPWLYGIGVPSTLLLATGAGAVALASNYQHLSDAELMMLSGPKRFLIKLARGLGIYRHQPVLPFGMEFDANHEE